jgi:hypothetical protein
MQPVSKQRLGKHVPAVNKPPQQEKGYVFCVVRAVVIAVQRRGKTAPQQERLFSAWSVPRGL